MLSKNVLYHGIEAQPVEPIQLRAGPLTMVFDPQIAFLRYIRVGEREILRGIYATLRDQRWGTVPPRMHNLRHETRDGGFGLTFDVECVSGGIDYLWHGRLSGDATGRVTYEFDGVSRSDFLRNRIGICVLHPIGPCAGEPCTIQHTDGSLEDGCFPLHISPHQPFKDVRAISHQVMPGLLARVEMQGEVFETEDQRNWTDDSFKTYCTPQAMPMPAQVRAGDRVKQMVTLTIEGDVSSHVELAQSGSVELVIGNQTVATLPAIGLGAASHDQPLSSREIQMLRKVKPAHLRVDLDLAGSIWPSRLTRLAGEARQLGCPLEVAIRIGDDAHMQLERLVDELRAATPTVVRYLVFSAGHLGAVRAALSNYQPHPAVFVGTDGDFTDLNRNRPALESADGICWTINPQVHAFDDATLAENAQSQRYTVSAARQFGGNLPLAVTPITLKRRGNTSVTAPLAASDGLLPRPVDQRQMSLFGAGWTLASIQSLAQAGADSLTYFETTGWRGILATEQGSPTPGLFQSPPNWVYPMYHVFADTADFAAAQVQPVASSQPLAVIGMALRGEGKSRLLLANLSPWLQRVCVRGLAGLAVQVRLLDETSAQLAMSDPQKFQAQPPLTMPLNNEALHLDLRPFALARIDGM